MPCPLACPGLQGWNVLPSAALVLLGAWAGAGKTLLALQGITGASGSWASSREAPCRAMRPLPPYVCLPGSSRHAPFSVWASLCPAADWGTAGNLPT